MTDLARLKDELIRDEGLRLKPYQDTVGKLTIGVGRNLEDRGLNRAEALYLLDNDIASAQMDLGRVLPEFPTFSDARQRALLNMVFNLGRARFSGFRKMIAAIRAGHWDLAAREALDSRWAEQVGIRADRIAAMLRNG